jgi:hypothetical protein
MSGSLLFVAFIGSVVMVAALFYFAIRRIRKKLPSESKPTTWDFVKELGGYAVLLVIFVLYVIGGLVTAIMRWF